MSSRQEEKERRRREREEAERAAASSSARRKRLGLALGGVLALAVAVVVALAVASGEDGEGAGAGAQNVPTQNQTNEAEAARAAGCQLQSHRVEGRGHTAEKVTYRTNPPTSGAHDPVASEDGIYPTPPDLEQSVHTLEHGRVNIQYKQGTPAQAKQRLTSLVETYEVKGTPGYHALLFENQTGMQPAVAATAWSKSLTCPAVNDRVYDAVRTFWKANVDKGPEFIP